MIQRAEIPSQPLHSETTAGRRYQATVFGDLHVPGQLFRITTLELHPFHDSPVFPLPFTARQSLTEAQWENKIHIHEGFAVI